MVLTRKEKLRLRTRGQGLTSVSPKTSYAIETIVSGGQTGADRAALDFAIKRGIPHRGWCPAGRKAQDGAIDLRYQLQETPSRSYSQRTEWNVRDCDGTVIFTIRKSMQAGSRRTMQFAKKLGKPWLHLAAARAVDHAALLRYFIQQHNLKTLNVAGPRKTEEATIGRFVTATLGAALSRRMAANRTPSVLVVDDDADTRAVYKALLQGLRVFEAENSSDAMRIAHRRKLDLVITDYVRPEGLNGLQFTSAMKAAHPSVPIIMASGMAYQGLRTRAFRAGVHSFFEKGVSPKRLLTTIDHVFSNVRFVSSAEMDTSAGMW